jgi:hypothetical protein
LPGHAESDYLRQLFKVVIIIHRLAVEGKMDEATLIERRTHLERWIDRLLGQALELAGEVRVRNRLKKQRTHLIGCLYDLATEPTNLANPRQPRRHLHTTQQRLDRLPHHLRPTPTRKKWLNRYLQKENCLLRKQFNQQRRTSARQTKYVVE